VIVGSIARRYAKALLAIGVAHKNWDALAKELDSIVDVFTGSRELQEALANPVFVMSKRRAIVEELTKRLALGKTMRNFLLLLVDRGRIGALPAIGREYRALADAQAGRVRVTVGSAKPLDPGVELRLKAVLEKRTGKTVVLEKHEDPGLLGGIVTQVGDLVFDGSVRTQLANLRQQLLSE